MSIASRRKDNLRRIPRWWEAKGPPRKVLAEKREDMKAFDQLRTPIRKAVQSMGGQSVKYFTQQEFGMTDDYIIETIVEDFND